MADKVKLLLLGDLILSDTNAGLNRLNSISNKYFIEADCCYGNLESPYTKEGRTVSKIGPHLRLSKSGKKFLKSLNLNVVNLANNHIGDFGFEGVKSSKMLVESFGAIPVGTKILKETVQIPKIVKIKNKSVGFLSFSEWQYNGENVYDNFIFSFVDSREIIDSILKLKKNVDFLVVTLNMGYEWSPFPNNKEIDLCRLLVDCGANIVIVHQPHVPRGYEKYKNSLITYGLGSFVTEQFSSWKRKKNFDWGLVFQVDLFNGKVKDFTVNSAYTQSDHVISIANIDEHTERKNYLQECNKVLLNRKLTQSFYEILAIEIFEYYYRTPFSWNERFIKKSLVEFLKRLLLRIIDRLASERLQKRHSARLQAFKNPTEHYLISSFLNKEVFKNSCRKIDQEAYKLFKTYM